MNTDDLLQKFNSDISSAVNKKAVDEIYLKYFSKSNGIITNLIKELSSLNIEDKKKLGPLYNNLSKEIKDRIDKKRER